MPVTAQLNICPSNLHKDPSRGVCLHTHHGTSSQDCFLSAAQRPILRIVQAQSAIPPQRCPPGTGTKPHSRPCHSFDHPCPSRRDLAANHRRSPGPATQSVAQRVARAISPRPYHGYARRGLHRAGVYVRSDTLRRALVIPTDRPLEAWLADLPRPHERFPEDPAFAVPTVPVSSSAGPKRIAGRRRRKAAGGSRATGGRGAGQATKRRPNSPGKQTALHTRARRAPGTRRRAGTRGRAQGRA